MSNPFGQSLLRAIDGTAVTRRDLLKGSVAAGVGALFLSAFGGTVFPQRASAGPLDSDLEILNYALTLELLEADAYKTALSLNVLTGRSLDYFKQFAMHELQDGAADTHGARRLPRA